MTEQIGLFLILLLLCSGCSSDEFIGPPQEEINIHVTVVDEDGKPLRPDRVWWYYPPDEQGQTKEFDAPCTNEDCTRFAVTGAEEGRVYVAASYRREHPDSHCKFSGYEATPVRVEAESAPEVTLRLVEKEGCY